MDLKKLDYSSSKINTISLFCGAGGLDLGVELAGLDIALASRQATNLLYAHKRKFDAARAEHGIFHVVFATDFFQEAITTYKNNFSPRTLVHRSDIQKITQFPKAELVIGGFPCPGFSSAGPRLIDDPRNALYKHFVRCLRDSTPKFFIAENVKGILSLGKGQVFSEIRGDFAEAGYQIYHKLVNARDYGVPQLRERVFLIGVRNDIDYNYEFPFPTHGELPGLTPYKTLEDAIKDLEDNPGEYFKGSYSSIYMSRNRKKRWEEQSFTIQASGRHAPLHPMGSAMKKVGKDKWVFTEETHNRRLSVRETARIQTFPDWFEFDTGNGNISKNGQLNKAYKQIGNAVPVELARAIATPIAKWFHSKNNQL